MIFRLCFVKFYEIECCNIKYHKLNKEKYIAAPANLTEFCNRQHPYKMKNKKINEHQVLKVLKDYKAGKSGLELFEKYGVYGTNIFELKHKYKDLGMDILVELVNLNEENSRLKTMYAELCIQHRKLKDLLKEDF